MRYYLYHEEPEDEDLACFTKTADNEGLFDNVVFLHDIMTGRDKMGPGYPSYDTIPPFNPDKFVVINSHQAREIVNNYILKHA